MITVNILTKATATWLTSLNAGLNLPAEAFHKLIATLSRNDTRFAHLLHFWLLRACLHMPAQFAFVCPDYLDLPLLLMSYPNLLQTPSARLICTTHLLRSIGKSTDAREAVDIDGGAGV